MRTPNPALARQVLDRIEADPTNWNQAVWAWRSPECGTAYCFAGHTVVLARPDALFLFELAESDASGAVSVQIDGELEDIDDVAADLLGLGSEESAWLFSPINSLADLRAFVAQMEAPGFTGAFTMPDRHHEEDDDA